jgi:predicted negative regulator of RcsB-dependent stress response
MPSLIGGIKMASESAFNKRLTEETGMEKVEGLLEHLNLPPKAIDFIRKNQRLLQIALAVVVVVVVSLSLYNSYRKGVVEDAASALSSALQNKGEERTRSLSQIAKNYGNTTSAQWAKIELAHLDMKDGEYSAAAEKYIAELNNLKESDPLYALLLFGAGQALEAGKKYSSAEEQYDLLKELKGYEHLGYVGLARIQEIQGNLEKANLLYNNYLLNIGDDPSSAQARTDIEARIARIKAKM